VDDPRCSGFDLHGANVFCLRDWNGQDEVAKKVGARRRNLHRILHFQNEIRCTELPVRCEHRRFVCFRGLSFGHSGFNPCLDERSILVRETAVICEVAIAGLGQPWWHVAGLCNGLDHRSPSLGISIREQTERTRAAGVMTTTAVVVKDGRNLPVEVNWGRSSSNAFLWKLV